MAVQMQDWRDAPEIDTSAIDALVGAVGPEAFAGLKGQFVADLKVLAGALLEAGRADNPGLVREKAHALRGVALNVGLLRLGHLAGALERGDTGDETEILPVLTASLCALEAAGKV